MSCSGTPTCCGRPRSTRRRAGITPITQGGYYQYSGGANLGSRSWLHYLLPMVYADPRWRARSSATRSGLQSRASGETPYGSVPLCQPYDLIENSDDLDFWLLMAAAEYGLGSRDTRFFSEKLPFSDSDRRVSVWRHLKIAFAHQESLRGPHGGYLAGGNGDWSDFSAIFLHMNESMLVPAQLAYAYPRLAELAELRGDREFAAKLRNRAAELRATLSGEWTGGWYFRGYTAAGTQIGSGAIFGEPQPWAILAGVPSRSQARRLVANIRRFLTGIGAPAALGGPAKIGSAQSPAARRSRRSPSPRPTAVSTAPPSTWGASGTTSTVG